MVNWDEANEFCRKLTRSCMTANAGEGPDDSSPSEAEWEYCCRAGTTTRYSFGDKAADLGDYAWYKDNSAATIRRRRQEPNPWGLYDMHGYVREWCADAWHKDHEGAAADGSPRPVKDNKERVLRGGSWAGSADTAVPRIAREKRWTRVATRLVSVVCRPPRRSRRTKNERETTARIRRAARLGRCRRRRGLAAIPRPNRDGTSPETGLFETWTKKGPRALVGQGRRRFAGPVVAGKRVVLFHRVGDEEVIECFDTDKGESQWKFAYATKYVDRFGKATARARRR